jgi:hypothetical protein
MDIQAALRIMRALANGTNPENSEPLESNSICRQPVVIRVLNRSIAALVAAKERERNRPTHAFRTWTRAEDAQVCEEVRKGIAFDDIAKAHNRTVPVDCGAASETREDCRSAAFGKGRLGFIWIWLR